VGRTPGNLPEVVVVQLRHAASRRQRRSPHPPADARPQSDQWQWPRHDRQLHAHAVPVYSDDPHAWKPAAQDGTQEFLTVTFAIPVFADGLTIRETQGNGFVTQTDAVDDLGQLHTVWTGVDPSQPGEPTDFSVT